MTCVEWVSGSDPFSPNYRTTALELYWWELLIVWPLGPHLSLLLIFIPASWPIQGVMANCVLASYKVSLSIICVCVHTHTPYDFQRQLANDKSQGDKALIPKGWNPTLDKRECHQPRTWNPEWTKEELMGWERGCRAPCELWVPRTGLCLCTFRLLTQKGKCLSETESFHQISHLRLRVCCSLHTFVREGCGISVY